LRPWAPLIGIDRLAYSGYASVPDLYVVTAFTLLRAAITHLIL